MVYLWTSPVSWIRAQLWMNCRRTRFSCNTKSKIFRDRYSLLLRMVSRWYIYCCCCIQWSGSFWAQNATLMILKSAIKIRKFPEVWGYHYKRSMCIICRQYTTILTVVGSPLWCRQWNCWDHELMIGFHGNKKLCHHWICKFNGKRGFVKHEYFATRVFVVWGDRFVGKIALVTMYTTNHARFVSRLHRCAPSRPRAGGTLIYLCTQLWIFFHKDKCCIRINEWLLLLQYDRVPDWAVAILFKNYTREPEQQRNCFSITLCRSIKP